MCNFVHFAERLFNECVSLQQMPNTPNGVTREDLAGALLPCLIASPDFTEFCIPLLLEKLDSQLRVAKLDSLHVLVSSGTSMWRARPCVKFFRVVSFKSEVGYVEVIGDKSTSMYYVCTMHNRVTLY
jgi:hypothetical protein